MKKMTILVMKKVPEAILPTKAYNDDAGWDLYAVENKVLEPHKQIEVDTGIVLSIPKGYYGHILTRSSFGRKQTQVHHGVIDSGYRGNITVLIYNLSDGYDYIAKGDKIAQLVILPVPDCQMYEIDCLPGSERGTKGFGSSGK